MGDNFDNNDSGNDNVVTGGETHVGDANSGDTNSGDTNSGDVNNGDANNGDANNGDLGTGRTFVGTGEKSALVTPIAPTEERSLIPVEQPVSKLESPAVEIPPAAKLETKITPPIENVTKVSEADKALLPVPDNREKALTVTVAERNLDGMIQGLNTEISAIQGNDKIDVAEKDVQVRGAIMEMMDSIGKSNMTTEQKVEAMQRVFAGIPEGAKKDIAIPERAEFLKPDMPFHPSGRPNYDFPDNLGFEGVPACAGLHKGMVLDRYGHSGGQFTCEVVDGKVEAYDPRSLPYEQNPEMYHQYEVLKDMDGFKSQIESLTVEDIMEIEKAHGRGNGTEAENRQEAEAQLAAIRLDMQSAEAQVQAEAQKHGWGEQYKGMEGEALRGKIAERFSYVDKEGNAHTRGGGEQIYLPSSVQTLIYLGYLKEK